MLSAGEVQSTKGQPFSTDIDVCRDDPFLCVSEESPFTAFPDQSILPESFSEYSYAHEQPPFLDVEHSSLSEVGCEPTDYFEQGSVSIPTALSGAAMPSLTQSNFTANIHDEPLNDFDDISGMFEQRIDNAISGLDTNDIQSLFLVRSELRSIVWDMASANSEVPRELYKRVQNILKDLALIEVSLANEQIDSLETSAMYRAMTTRGDLDSDSKVGFTRFESELHVIPALRHTLELAEKVIIDGQALTVREAIEVIGRLDYDQVYELAVKVGLGRKINYSHHVKIFKDMERNPDRAWVTSILTADQFDRNGLPEVARTAYDHGAYVLSERNYDIYFAGNYKAAENDLPFESYVAGLSDKELKSILKKGNAYDDSKNILGDVNAENIEKYLAAEAELKADKEKLAKELESVEVVFRGLSEEELAYDPRVQKYVDEIERLSEKEEGLIKIRLALQVGYKEEMRHRIANGETYSPEDDIIWKEFDSRLLKTDKRWWEIWRLDPLTIDGLIINIPLDIFSIMLGGIGGKKVAQVVLKKMLTKKLVKMGLERELKRAIRMAEQKLINRSMNSRIYSTTLRSQIAKSAKNKATMELAKKELGALRYHGAHTLAFAGENTVFLSTTSLLGAARGDGAGAFNSWQDFSKAWLSSAFMLKGYHYSSLGYAATAGRLTQGLRPVAKGGIDILGTTVFAAPTITSISSLEANLSGIQLSEVDIADSLFKHTITSFGLGGVYLITPMAFSNERVPTLKNEIAVRSKAVKGAESGPSAFLEGLIARNSTGRPGYEKLDKFMTFEDRASMDEVLPNPKSPELRQQDAGSCALLSTVYGIARLDHSRQILSSMIMPVEGGWLVTFATEPGKQIFVSRSDIEAPKTAISDVTTPALRPSEGNPLFRILEIAFGRKEQPDADAQQALKNLHDGVELNSFHTMMDGLMGGGSLEGAHWNESNVVRVLTMLHENPNIVMMNAAINGDKPKDAPRWLKTPHAYSVKDYDPKTREVTVHDPHGTESRIPLSEFTKYFSVIDYGVLSLRSIEDALGGKYFAAPLDTHIPYNFDLKAEPLMVQYEGSKHVMYYGEDGGIRMYLEDGLSIHIVEGASFTYEGIGPDGKPLDIFTVQNRGEGRVIINSSDPYGRAQVLRGNDGAPVKEHIGPS